MKILEVYIIRDSLKTCDRNKMAPVTYLKEEIAEGKEYLFTKAVLIVEEPPKEKE